jgi:nucleotide-binding universal stress UspA family protein
VKVRSIFVPLDGSPFAEAALPLATSLAQRAKARIRLALVHPAAPGVGLGGEGATIAARVREREGSYLGATAERLGPGVTVEAVHLDGHPGAALAAEVERGDDDLIVMATHGRGALSRMWLGSVADYLVRHVTVPLLLVRPAKDEPGYEGVRFSYLLVPLDASETSEAILDPAMTLLGLAGDGHSRVTLITVLEPVLAAGEPGLPVAVPLDPRLIEEQRRIAEKRLQGLAARLRSEGVEVDARVVSAATSPSAILELAESEKVDLIALTTHGEGGLRRVLLGRVADKVIRGAHVPVLVLRPKGASHG